MQSKHRPIGRPRQFGRSCTILLSHYATAAHSVIARSIAPFRLAIIGSGPAGFYAAYRVMKRLPHSRIDMYEALPVPFGLVRYGVAPDHPEVKNCEVRFKEIASSPNFQFLGNVSIGKSNRWDSHCSVRLESLTRHYDSILMAYGASEDKKLGIPGESTLSGIYSARRFVGWFNGHPDCADLEPNLAQVEDVIIIGQGNVAFDLARILLDDIGVLRRTDIADRALAELANSRIRQLRVVGRRGPMQAAFTIKELRELLKLRGVAFHPVERSLVPKDLGSLTRPFKRLMEVLLDGSSASHSTVSRSWSLESCLSPKRFLSDTKTHQTVATTEFDVTKLVSPFDPKSQIRATGNTHVLPSDLVIRSVGYKSTALAGFSEAGIQFDEKRGIVLNDGLGRAVRFTFPENSGDPVETRQVAGLYCAGWLKRGPTGVIATTMQDAFITADAIIEDWLAGARFLSSGSDKTCGGWEAVRQEAGPDTNFAVSWDQWLKIDLAERRRGKRCGKPREKFTTVKEMLSIIG
ncbi:hypothetical protein XA68_10361 [Ophiocordyceps unilateralis]|uniref:NADPH:adrenodoxin oxidoreductase, mitochondrial n=1 Tax=Ophiocordyceps unilateralis TaxID=268505 RepID=A0A2A9P215_OPHUN|nr:hypothetical protein XA68_10361 [Ophiocordyceps unilateralis]